MLIASGIDVNYGRADIGGNQIFQAIGEGSFEITKLIFEKGVDIHTTNRWGYTPLDTAIFGGHKEIEKRRTGWGPRVNLGPNVNTDADEIQPTVTRDGTVYFSHLADIYRSRPVDGRYAPKEKLPAPINSDDNQVNPNISADERFLIFRSLGPRGFREPSSFFSSLNADGTWSEPVAIDKRIAKIGLFGNLTPDRKYWICFEGGDLFWLDVSAFMEELTAPRSSNNSR